MRQKTQYFTTLIKFRFFGLFCLVSFWDSKVFNFILLRNKFFSLYCNILYNIRFTIVVGVVFLPIFYSCLFARASAAAATAASSASLRLVCNFKRNLIYLFSFNLNFSLVVLDQLCSAYAIIFTFNILITIRRIVKLNTLLYKYTL